MDQPVVTLLPAAARPPRPWLNGGGITFDIACHPPGADLASFEWRLSNAIVTESGSFSTFPGVARSLAILSGQMKLAIGPNTPLALNPASEVVHFSGTDTVNATPILGEVSDLNLMVRHGGTTARMERAPAGRTTLVQNLAIIVASAPTLLYIDGRSWRLGAGDAARIESGLGAAIDLDHPCLIVRVSDR